jgi:hypothetical protein
VIRRLLLLPWIALLGVAQVVLVVLALPFIGLALGLEWLARHLNRAASVVDRPFEWLCEGADWCADRRDALGAPGVPRLLTPFTDPPLVAPGGPAVKAFLATHPDTATWEADDFEGYLDACAADINSGAVPRPGAVTTS